MLESLERHINHWVGSVSESCNWVRDSKQLQDMSLSFVLCSALQPRTMSFLSRFTRSNLLERYLGSNRRKSMLFSQSEMSRSSCTKEENKSDKTTHYKCLPAFTRRFCHDGRKSYRLLLSKWRVGFSALKRVCLSCACRCASFIYQAPDFNLKLFQIKILRVLQFPRSSLCTHEK